VSSVTGLEDLVGAEGHDTLVLADGREVPRVAPADEEACAEVLARSSSQGHVLTVQGGNTRAPWYPPTHDANLVLSTHRMRGIVAYEPEDGTLTALAGTPMAELEAAVSAGGHHLSPEVPHPETATLGGVVAGGRSGFDRLRHGPVREQVLGTRVALADGTRARSGGSLVKNVTGYDLHRLFCGSHGTLGVICEVSLRLYPAVRSERVIRSELPSLTEALAGAGEIAASRVSPLALTLDTRGPRPRLEVFLGGREEVVAAEGELVASIVPVTETLADEAARERRREARHEQDPAPLHVHTPPSALSEVLDTLSAADADSRFFVHPALATIAVFPGTDTELSTLARELAPARARLFWPGLDDPSTPVFPQPRPAARAWMERLRASLDPDGLFASGRFLR